MSAQRVLFDAPGPRARRRHAMLTVVGAAAIAALLAVIIVALYGENQLTAARWTPFVQADTWTDYLLPGIRSTLLAAAIAIVLSFVLGLVLAMGRMSDHAWIRWPTGVFVEFFRAVPVLIMMIFTFFFLNYNTSVPSASIPLIAVIAGLVFYNSSVIAEVVRSGVGSLPAGQREAGLSLGLQPSQVRRQILVPQALTAMLPTLVSQLVVVLKDTALGYIITYPELLNYTRQLGSRYGNIFAAFVVAGIIYILINWAITKVAEMLEGRSRRQGRGVDQDTDTDADETVNRPPPGPDVNVNRGTG